MAQSMKKTLIVAATVVGLSTTLPYAEPLMRGQMDTPEATAQDTKSDDETKSALILAGLLVAGSYAAYRLTCKGSMFGNHDNDDQTHDDKR